MLHRQVSFYHDLLNLSHLFCAVATLHVLLADLPFQCCTSGAMIWCTLVTIIKCMRDLSFLSCAMFRGHIAFCKYSRIDPSKASRASPAAHDPHTLTQLYTGRFNLSCFEESWNSKTTSQISDSSFFFLAATSEQKEWNIKHLVTEKISIERFHKNIIVRWLLQHGKSAKRLLTAVSHSLEMGQKDDYWQPFVTSWKEWKKKIDSCL